MHNYKTLRKGFKCDGKTSAVLFYAGPAQRTILMITFDVIKIGLSIVHCIHGEVMAWHLKNMHARDQLVGREINYYHPE